MTERNTILALLKPIKDAPKNGTPILGYADEEFATVYWSRYRGSDGRWELCVCGSHADDGEWNPTHWMPLPTMGATQRAIKALLDSQEPKASGQAMGKRYKTKVLCPVCGVLWDTIEHEDPRPWSQIVGFAVSNLRRAHGLESPECAAHPAWDRGWHLEPVKPKAINPETLTALAGLYDACTNISTVCSEMVHLHAQDAGHHQVEIERTADALGVAQKAITAMQEETRNGG
jgi:hypothetical protein